ncbi:hypothetical protein K438DRAFT_1747140 [Mycena galopus ATCC 62051]|nr:hypothetical protein K438DRAFT_1747140 [Mycena galopus ATCC 62051]
MAPSKWTTDCQEALLLKHYDSYKRAKENQKSIFFAEFPAEAVLKFPTVPEGERRPLLTSKQLIVLGNATQLTQNQLKQWMRNCDQHTVNVPAESVTAMSNNLLFQLKSRKTRPMRLVEKYQILYHAKIQAAVKADITATLEHTSYMGIPANVVALDEHVQREVIAAANTENVKCGEVRPPAGAAADGMTPQSY